ncbi:type II toxin-antitoxin system PemK/MazF family toxin [Actinoplanes italicus]|uniref:PemK-like, MazF-like toxin of type II toxin-antitoxin system n=1 Tax=Actinoplanes italicus TaxID=113567 RepID=A0A2T0K4L6_9ACTN|nr:type II toxin-antitoxin system PemK/MazF family toxin [Actinoplanes italicus]PRX17847.1 PemK-like, MazF-like toxin of type II toxin-antitoxin system [Actinoplanes italicus]
MLKAFLRRIFGTPTAPAPKPSAPSVPKKEVAKPAAPKPTAPPVKAAPPRKAAVKSAVPRQGRQLAYAPNLDGDADPGEIVWTWVPYEDDPTQGKDRPVVVVGRDARTLLGLMLSSQSDRDGQRHWLALGPGEWDRDARPSWVRLDRVIEVDEDGIRREGAILDRPRFDRIAAILRRNYGWP